MAGTIAQRAVGYIPSSGQVPLSAGQVNSFRVKAVVDRLTSHFQPGSRSEPNEFFTLCLSLARGIDYAIANNDVPPRAQELPSLLKQVYQRKNEPRLQAGVMVLMISVKNACKSQWFSAKDAEELLNLAHELGRSFCSPGDIKIEPSSLPHVVSNVMSRFFPRMKLGHVLTSIEVQPGYGAFAVDFHILKEKVPPVPDKIWLMVVQTDAILTSSCLVSPPKVNFLLNGKGVVGRIDVAMDTGPQLPTNVTQMLKYGTNLLQAIGQFNGNYIIAVAIMTMTEFSEIPSLQDYVRPFAAALESDSEIVEGASRISLNCPISFRRIKNPVKGQLCKHHQVRYWVAISLSSQNIFGTCQCFDFGNYISINSRRPSWRCPHCNQSVCYMDLRIDQNMVKVLREVAGKVVDVIVSADGSWKPVVGSDDKKDEHCDRSPRNDQDGSEQSESTKYSNTVANTVDLTMEDADENEVMGTCAIEDRKPFKDGHPGPAAEVPLLLQTSNNSEITQNYPSRIEDDFWSGIFFPGSSTANGSVAPAISESPVTNLMMTPVQTDAVSLAFNREVVDLRGTGQVTTSIPQTPTFGPSNLQLHPSQVGNSLITTEFGRSIPRYVERNPIAVQALPAPSQMSVSHNRSRANAFPLISSGSPYASQTSSIVPPLTDALATSEADRQQHSSRSHLSSTPAADMSSSSMLQYPMSQNWEHQARTPYAQSQLQQVVGHPSTSSVPSSYRSGHPSERHNQHHHAGISHAASQQTTSHTPTYFRPVQIQQGGAQGVSGQEAGATNSHNRLLASTHRSAAHVARSPPAVPVQLQAPRTGTSFPDRLRSSIEEQRVTNMGSGSGPVSRADVMNELPSEQNWRPTGRMRGSLSGRAYSAALNQFLIQPTASAPQATLPTPDMSSTSGLSQLQAMQERYANHMKSVGNLGNNLH